VYDYRAGKQDWLAAGLPTEGEQASEPRAGGFARKDVPVCRLDERVGDVRERVRAAGWNACVAVNAELIVLGLLRADQLDAQDEARVEEAMRPGPSTFRAHVPIEEMAHFMIDHNMESAPVTTPEGRLLGMLLREDAARAAMELHRARHSEEAAGVDG
jgi:CBS domain-containing protein